MLPARPVMSICGWEGKRGGAFTWARFMGFCRHFAFGAHVNIENSRKLEF